LKKCLAIALFLIFDFCILMHPVSAQAPIDNKSIPESVKKNFADKFPSVQNPIWTQPSPGFLETNFVFEKHYIEVMFSTFGDWVSTDTKLKVEEFPASATAYLASNISGGKITGYFKSETMKGIGFYAEVKESGKIFTYTFDADGNFLSKVEEEE